MSLTDKSYKEPAGQNDLPVFAYLWVWATARLTAFGGQPDALLAMGIVGRGLAPAEIQYTANVENWLYL